MLNDCFIIYVESEKSHTVLFKREVIQPADIAFPFDSICQALGFLFKNIPHIIVIQKSSFTSKN